MTPSQLSVTVSGIQFITAPHTPLSLFTEISEGQFAITGGTLSVTTTSKEQVLEFKAASVKVYVTLVVPTGKRSPGLCERTNVGVLQLSVAVGSVQVTAASQVVAPTAVVPVIVPVGQPEMTGASVSITVTVCVAVVVYPLENIAVQVITVEPRGSGSGASFVKLVIVQVAVVVGVPKATLLSSAPQPNVVGILFMSAGAVIVGFSTTTVAVVEFVQPPTTVAS